MWLFFTTVTLLFQLLAIKSQDFTINNSPITIPPSALIISVNFEESGQFVYLSGVTSAGFDGEKYNGGTDVFLLKLYMNGSRIWTRITGGSGNDWANKLLLYPATFDLFMVGTTTASVDNQTFAGARDSLIVKYAQNGTKLFTRLFGTVVNSEIAMDAFIDMRTQMLVISGVYDNVLGVTINFMNNGSLLRSYQYSDAGLGLGITPAALGSDVFVTGTRTNPIDATYDIVLTRMNFYNGTRYWIMFWGGDSFEEGYDVIYDSSTRHVFVSGYTTSTLFYGQPTLGSGTNDALLICAADNGTFLWSARWGTTSNDYAYALFQHQPSGTIFSLGHYGSSGYVASFSQNGTTLQFKTSVGDYRDVSLASSYQLAFVADYSGNFIWLNISYASNVASNASISSTKMPSTSFPVYTTALWTSSLPGAYTTQVPTIAAPMIASPTIASVSPPFTPTASSISVETTAISDPQPNAEVSSGPKPVPMALIYTMVGIVSVLLLVLTFLCSYVKFHSSLRDGRKQSTTTESGAMSSETTNTENNFSTTTMTETQQTSMTTLMRSNFELSLPGYLAVESRSCFRITKQIAKGGGGVVFTAEALTRGLSVYGPNIIVKSLGPGSGASLHDLTERQQKLFKQEIAIMHYFRRERYIAKLVGWCEDPACVLMKLYVRGSLDKWIYGNASKSKVDSLQFMQDVSRGILAMHSVGFVHCDLKPQNVLIDSDEQGRLFCCLTDFGISQIVDETTLLVRDFVVTTIKGLSVQYAAPDAFERFRSTYTSPPTAELVMKSDLYSLGVILFELLLRRQPWQK